MPSVFKHLHLKRNTAGSSNELSLDVLDAARQELDTKSKKRASAALLPKRKNSQEREAKQPASKVAEKEGAQHIAATDENKASQGTFVAQAEVARRKKARRANALRMRIIVVCASVVVLIAAGLFLYNVHLSNVAFSNEYESLVQRVSNVDEGLVDMDAVMQAPLSSESAATREKLLKVMPAMKGELEAVSNEIAVLGETFHGTERDVALAQLNNTVEERLNLISAAAATFGMARDADKVVDAANKAWSDVLKADQTAREAATAASGVKSDDDIVAAEELTQKAITELETAKEELKAIDPGKKGTWFAEEIAYLEMRIEALKYASATAAALLAGDREQAKQANESYNAADMQAAVMAEQMPASMGDVAWSMFEEDLKSYGEEYASARARVAEYDADIRAYLSR